MHRFYFHLHQCGVSYLDEEGRELPSFEIALQEAFREARSLMAEEMKSGHLCLGCRIDISDSYGIPLVLLPPKWLTGPRVFSR
ncbi:DUF6894 family protein [Sphingomonas xinjiangensis]|uniref:DUF6894 domain-containing protein n=1 Tax=Sphingomonas xinjiangensis TaxID=643568 RepID=A0A840Y831_9SPHN|nr:hypothetical protein [Sphingomonas xinjiangensis]